MEKGSKKKKNQKPMKFHFFRTLLIKKSAEEMFLIPFSYVVYSLYIYTT